jgi:hypothetical protein
MRRRIPKLARQDKAPHSMIFFAERHFPLSRKRFMVRPGFAIGRLGLSINIKGLS